MSYSPIGNNNGLETFLTQDNELQFIGLAYPLPNEVYQRYPYIDIFPTLSGFVI